MPLTYTQQLDSLQISIQKLESGGAKSINFLGRNVMYQDLDVLYKREQWLLSRIAKENNNGGRGGFKTHSVRSVRD